MNAQHFNLENTGPLAMQRESLGGGYMGEGGVVTCQ